jgi:hypothetical protein
LENWSLVLALMPNLRAGRRKRSKMRSKIIRAQAGPNEMRYLRLTQQHPRLREGTSAPGVVQSQLSQNTNGADRKACAVVLTLYIQNIKLEG